MRGKSATYLSNIENPRHGKLHVVVKPHCFEKRRRVVNLERKKLHVMPRHFRFHAVLTSALMPTNCFRVLVEGQSLHGLEYVLGKTLSQFQYEFFPSSHS